MTFSSDQFSSLRIINNQNINNQNINNQNINNQNNQILIIKILIINIFLSKCFFFFAKIRTSLPSQSANLMCCFLLMSRSLTLVSVSYSCLRALSPLSTSLAILSYAAFTYSMSWNTTKHKKNPKSCFLFL